MRAQRRNNRRRVQRGEGRCKRQYKEELRVGGSSFPVLTRLISIMRGFSNECFDKVYHLEGGQHMQHVVCTTNNT